MLRLTYDRAQTPSLLEQEKSLLAQIANQEQKLAQLYTKNSAQKLVQETEQELGRLLDEYEAVQTQMRGANPRYAALTQSRSLTLTEMQHLLDDNTLLLEFEVGEQRSYLWAVSRSELDFYELPGRATLDYMSRRFYALQTPTTPAAQYETEAARLGQMLIGPAAGQLANRRLVIVPDGALHYVPFAALSVSKVEGKSGNHSELAYRPLMADHEIVYLPSASALVAIRQTSARREPAARALALFADPIFSKADLHTQGPVGLRASRGNITRLRALRSALRQAGIKDAGLTRLPSSRIEAEAIMSAATGEDVLLALGLDASLPGLKSADLSQYRTIHFATHGIIDSARPEMSSLVLSLVNERGESQNGFLRLHDIYTMNLRADLVVLSACETAMGKEIRGEGLVSLTRGFMHAGATRVMASLWKIDDAATAELMKRFYAKMLREGKKPAAALRESQHEMWQQRRWQSPFYWAAFVQQGEWN